MPEKSGSGKHLLKIEAAPSSSICDWRAGPQRAHRWVGAGTGGRARGELCPLDGSRPGMAQAIGLCCAHGQIGESVALLLCDLVEWSVFFHQ